jgi:hypothetical protein
MDYEMSWQLAVGGRQWKNLGLMTESTADRQLPTANRHGHA